MDKFLSSSVFNVSVYAVCVQVVGDAHDSTGNCLVVHQTGHELVAACEHCDRTRFAKCSCQDAHRDEERWLFNS